jgi:hypothetical protein
VTLRLHPPAEGHALELDGALPGALVTSTVAEASRLGMVIANNAEGVLVEWGHCEDELDEMVWDVWVAKGAEQGTTANEAYRQEKEAGRFIVHKPEAK